MYNQVKNSNEEFSASISCVSDSNNNSSSSSSSEDDCTTMSTSAIAVINEKDAEKLSNKSNATADGRRKKSVSNAVHYWGAPLTMENRRRQRLNAKLLTAIECGNPNSFRLCLYEGAEPNATCRKTGMTACHLAALFGRDDMLSILLSQGADSLRYNWLNGCLPLHLASWSGCVSCVKRLIQNHSGSLNIPTKQITIDRSIVEIETLDSPIHCHDYAIRTIPVIPVGSTALHMACRNLKKDCVILLLNCGADVNAKDERNLSAISVISEDVESDWNKMNKRKSYTPSSVYSKRPSSVSSHRKTAISSLNGTSNNSIMSCVSIDTVVISSSSGSSNSDEMDSNHRSGGTTGSKSNKIRTSRDDIFGIGGDGSSADCVNGITNNSQQQSDNEITDKSYLTAHTKTSKYESDTIRIILDNLIERGAYLEIGSDSVVRDDKDSIVCSGSAKKNCTLLHTAVAAQDARLIEQLIETGFSVLDRNDNGDTPLDMAIKRRLPLSLEILMKSAPNLKAILENRDATNKTFLHATVCESWIFGVGILLEAGASVIHKSKNDNTVFHYAAQTGNATILEELLCFSNVNEIIDCKNSMGETALMVAVQYGNVECVQRLLDYGANTRLSLSSNVTVVHVAAEKGYAEILELILKADPDLKDAKTNDGLTALHAASMKGHLLCVRYLLSINCDEFARTATTYFGGTPLHFAARNGHLAVVECLIEHNRDLTNVVNVDGWYPLHIAAAFGHEHCVQSIIKSGGDLSGIVTDSEGNRKTAVDIISYTISDPVEFLRTILDSYIGENTLPLNHRKCVITFDYGIFLPLGKRKKQMNVLNAFLNNQNVSLQNCLFLHPLVQTFLHLKWRKLRLFFFVSVLFYLLFTLSLTVFAFDVYVWKLPVVKMVSGSIMLSTLLLLSLQEILHASKLQRYYITDVESLLKWSAFIVAFAAAICGSLISAATSDLSGSNCTNDGSVHNSNGGNEEKNVTTLNDANGKSVGCNYCQDITAVAILLSWLELLFILSRFPGWGFYVLMFFHVASRILKVFSTFACLIIGFMLSFYILFNRASPFVGVWETFVKVIVMTSELDYSDMFSNIDERSSTWYVGRLVFLSFVLLVGIVLMNLMIGLAVNDITLLESEGKSRTLAKQIDFLNMLETFVCHKKFVIFLPRSMRKRIKAYHMVSNTFKYHPGRPLSSMAKKLPTKLRHSILEKALELQQNSRRNAASNNECSECKEPKNARIGKSSSSSSSSPPLRNTRFDVEEILKNVTYELDIIRHRISNVG